MGDILSQEEIDALLASVAASSDTLQAVAAPAPVAERGKREGEDKKVSLYDFRRPDRVSKDQMRTLQNFHEGFARLISTTLTSYLRTLIEVELVSVDQLTYSEFVMSVTNPSCIYIFQMEPLAGSAIYEINPSLVFFMVDRLFGGPGKPIQYNRELTDIERTVMNKIVERLLADLKEAWEYMGIFNPKIESYETNPQFVQICPPSETVILISFELRSRHSSGLMSLCMPYMFLEPVMGSLSVETWISSNRQNLAETRRVVEKEIASTPLDVTAVLGKLEMTLGQMLELRPGDILCLDKPASSEIVLTAGGKPRFLARPGQVRNHKSVQVTALIEREVGDVD